METRLRKTDMLVAGSIESNPRQPASSARARRACVRSRMLGLCLIISELGSTITATPERYTRPLRP
jgi:hypothetical protein